jgi:hypothetical protein
MNGLLQGAERVDLAVGYLFVEGLIPLAPAFKELSCTRLLIGNVVNRMPEESIRHELSTKPSAFVGGDEDAFARPALEHRNRVAAMTALNLRQTINSLPRTDEISSALLDLAYLISERKLQVRVYTAGRMHAKATLVFYKGDDEKNRGVAVVGSSNLTLPTSDTDYESHCNLDILLQDRKNVEAVTSWFENRWAGAQDFQKELFEEFARHWS